MTQHNDGGPAFPGEQGTDPNGLWNQTWSPGMSLWDYYAGQALAGACAHNSESTLPQRARARWCAEMADAMLEERERRMRTWTYFCLRCGTPYDGEKATKGG